MLPSFKRGNIPTQTISQILKPLFCDFLEALQFEEVAPRLCTFHMDLHPPTHVRLKFSNGSCLGYVVLSVMQIFRPIGIICT